MSAPKYRGRAGFMGCGVAVDEAGVGTACINGSRRDLARALRRLRAQSPELARDGVSWACWVGWPVLLPEERHGRLSPQPKDDTV